MKRRISGRVAKLLAENKADIESRFAVRRLALFGSHARGETTRDSDVDVLVEFVHPSFDGYMDLKFHLEELLRAPVDLVMSDTVKPRLRGRIAKEAVYV